MKKILIILLFVTHLLSYEKIETHNFVKYSLALDFDDLIFALKDEMISNGFTLSYDSNIAVSANAMAKHRKEEDLYLKARKLGFCKNTLGYNLIKENRDNIIYCPFGIGIYQTEKNNITIIYHTAQKLDTNEKAVNTLNTNIIAIIETLLEDLQ